MILLSLIIEGIQEYHSDHVELIQSRQKRQSLETNFNDPYYAFNPDYMGGNMPNIQLYQNNPNIDQTSSCTCRCGEMSYGPPVTCNSPTTCVAYCLQMYPGQCTLINTYGCCGSYCKYFQSQALETRHCTCNCGNQQFFNPSDTCLSSQACLIQCRSKFSQACTTMATQACCGSDCQTYSQAVATSCSCLCQGNTYYPSPRCAGPDGCMTTCMTVRTNNRMKILSIYCFLSHLDLWYVYSWSNTGLLWHIMYFLYSNMYM